MLFFYSNGYILQDKNLERMIGHIREMNGLYYIEDPNMLIKSHSVIFESTMANKEKNPTSPFSKGHFVPSCESNISFLV